MKRIFLIILTATIMVFGVGRGAYALLITHEYSAKVSFIDPVLLGGDSPFVLGQTFTFRYTYDDATPDIDAQDNHGSFNAIVSLNVSVDSYTTSFNNGYIDIYDDNMVDSYWVRSSGLPVVGGDTINIYNELDLASFYLSDPGSPGPITSDALPYYAYDPADFGYINELQLRFVDINENMPHLLIADTELSVTKGPVPEPASVLLVCTGLIGLTGFRKKLKK